ncbi:protein nirF [Halomonas daqingensis]|uniref:cytochrome D1 domain-containing protein n=1 Tax=Billgrantia desiderata TaxID=52021 RepID=UPI000A372641|nr:cytochrome D1 domain-containing protein [Halomonas desiderata]MCE8013770.1 protein nirF [Halomonas desiderata]MCE8030485.1 protein nirF [Halomonas desiderata]OUE40427.1 protein nirF [Halomonas desiderata SP1]
MAIPHSLKTLLAGSALALLTAGQALAEPPALNGELRGTGDLGVVIERATGSVALVDTSARQVLRHVEGFGDLSHASVKFTRDARYAFVFGRDGGLTRLDLLTGEIDGRIIQGGNSIGGAISQDGRFVAVGNYEPGGVKVFDTETMELVIDVPATYRRPDGSTAQAKVVGVVDVPGNVFVFSLFEAGEIWTLDMSQDEPELTQYRDVGSMPYDALITANGRYYIAGLFGEDGMALLDLWHPENGVQRILPDYGQGEQRLPVYKMPHLEGWAMAGDQAFFPAVGRNEVLVADSRDWSLTNRIEVHGQPIFVMSHPDERQVWVTFAHPLNDKVQVIDTQTHEVIRTLEPGASILHKEFTPRGEHIWISARDSNQVVVYDTRTFEELARLPAESPSGIFFTHRAHKIGL